MAASAICMISRGPSEMAKKWAAAAIPRRLPAPGNSVLPMPSASSAYICAA